MAISSAVYNRTYEKCTTKKNPKFEFLFHYVKMDSNRVKIVEFKQE